VSFGGDFAVSFIAPSCRARAGKSSAEAGAQPFVNHNMLKMGEILRRKAIRR